MHFHSGNASGESLVYMEYAFLYTCEQMCRNTYRMLHTRINISQQLSHEGFSFAIKKTVLCNYQKCYNLLATGRNM
jgi:hypothetical protein